jgi:hypothetical protein
MHAGDFLAAGASCAYQSYRHFLVSILAENKYMSAPKYRQANNDFFQYSFKNNILYVYLQ